MRARLSPLVIPALAFASFCNAATFEFSDLSETLSVSLDGIPITGNGGRISNFTLGPELVSFDVSTNGFNFTTTAGFTNLLDPANSDDPANTLSDRIVLTFTLNATTYHVAFGSDPSFPAIPD